MSGGLPRGFALWLAGCCAFVSGRAEAQWAGLDRMDETIKGLFQSTLVLDDAFLEDGFVFSYNELYLQGAYAGFGGYLIVPIAALTNGSYSVSTLGNVEVGGLWDVALPLLNVTLRAGVAAPTVRADNDSQTTIGVASWCRLTDLALTVPETVPVRLGVSLRLPAGILHARIDTGFDLLLPVGEGVSAKDFDTIFRLNAGVGMFWRGFGGSLEYALATRVVDTKIEFKEDALPHALMASIRFRLRWVELYVAGTLPLASAVVGQIGGFTVGVTSRFTADAGGLRENPEAY